MADLATRAGRRGGGRLRIHAPAAAPDQGRDRGPRDGARRRLRHDQQLLRPGCRRRRLRPLRVLPPPPQGIRGGRSARPREVSGRPRMTYAVKEIFYTLQGEGANAGRPAVFCRFAGCNLWTGREEDRAEAVCRFCDTEFVGTDGPGGGKFSHSRRAGRRGRRRVARRGSGCAAARGLHRRRAAPPARRAADPGAARGGVRGRGRDQRHGRSAPGARLGVREPEGRGAAPGALGRRAQAGLPPGGRRARAVRRARLPAFLPPADGRVRARGQHRAALAYCLAHPRWRLSLQTHKLLGIP